MIIHLKNFGTTLISRQLGREAFLAFRPSLGDLKSKENLEIDFDGVITFSPSWGDEFITPLQKEFGKRLSLHKTDNPSVNLTLDLLEKANSFSFERK